MNNLQTDITQLTNRMSILERKVNDCCGSAATRSSEWTSPLPPTPLQPPPEEELVNDAAAVEEMDKIPVNDAALINKVGVNRSLITFADPSISKIEKKSSSKKKKKKSSSSSKKKKKSSSSSKKKKKSSGGKRTKKRTRRTRKKAKRN